MKIDFELLEKVADIAIKAGEITLKYFNNWNLDSRHCETLQGAKQSSAIKKDCHESASQILAMTNGELLLKESVIARQHCDRSNLDSKNEKLDFQNFVQIKDDESPVTLADTESSAFIVKSLGEISNFKVCSEESILDFSERKNENFLWLVDPLDGTKDFLANQNGWTINIALINNQQSSLGVVYAPTLGILWGAVKGLGAWKWERGEQISATSGVKISLQREVNLDSKKLIALDSVFHSNERTQNFFKHYDLNVQKLGSSLKICALAENKAHIYPRFNGTKIWDTAAADVILSECGGELLSIETLKPLPYNKQDFKNDFFIAFSACGRKTHIYDEFVNQIFKG